LSENFQVFPTLPIVLGFRGTSFDVVDFYKSSGGPKLEIPGVKLDLTKVLDGERELTLLKPLPKEGGTFILKNKITGAYDVGKAAVIESTTIVIGKEDQQEYVKIVSFSFYRDAGGFGGDRPPKPPAATVAPLRPADKSVTYKTTPTQAILYRLSGDYNPLHADPAVAKKVGFPAPILHGLCSYGHAARAILDAWCKNDSAPFRSLRARFSSPVFPGETLRVDMWDAGIKDGLQSVTFTMTIVERNVVCINGGLATLKASHGNL
jgi:peroxisomal enoyl-CoA hydratase 2